MLGDVPAWVGRRFVAFRLLGRLVRRAQGVVFCWWVRVLFEVSSSVFSMVLSLFLAGRERGDVVYKDGLSTFPKKKWASATMVVVAG